MTACFPLPELSPPAGMDACSLCRLARHRSSVTWAEGRPAALLDVKALQGQVLHHAGRPAHKIKDPARVLRTGPRQD